jgi:excisionase family DNA binding protein
VDLLADSVVDRFVDRLAALAMKRYYSVAEASVYTSLSCDTIRAMLSARKLTALRPVGGRVLMDRRELDALLQASTACPRRRRGTYDRAG